MNSVNIIGNIGHDLEVRYTGNGKAVLNFNIAVRQFNGDTSWFRVTAWERLAETVNQYCGKGSKVGVSGYLVENKFTDKNGDERSSVEITAQSVDFMDAKPNNQQQNNYNSGSNQGQRDQQQQSQNENPFANVDFSNNDPFESNNETEILDDDLPF